MKTPPLPLPRAAVLFRLLGDECRLRLLLELAEHGPQIAVFFAVVNGSRRLAAAPREGTGKAAEGGPN